MKKYVLLLFILFSAVHYGQSLSKTQILYESKGQIVMNNGKQYEILSEKAFYEVSDASIEPHKQVADDLLRLNRVLILKTNNEYTKLIEWIKHDMRFYENRNLVDFEIDDVIHNTTVTND